MNSVFDGLHHLPMRLEPDKNQKNRRQIISRFYCWQHNLAHISGHGCYKRIRFSVVCIIYRCAYSKIKIRKISDKKVSVFTAGSILGPISRVNGVINELRLQPDKNQKNRRPKKFRFYCWQDFWPIYRVMGVINEFRFRCVASFTDALTAR